jgi:hypothetical protein
MARRGRPSKSRIPKIKSRPLRTREHVIADLSILHLQWIVANCGFVAEVPDHDYGYDLVLFTYTEAGEIENSSVLFQVKATDALEKYVINDGKTISFPIGRQYIALWRAEPMPVILVVYDAINERAYWLYTQRYFELSGIALAGEQSEISLHLPTQNIVDANAVRTFRALKQDALRRIREVSLHRDESDV